MTALRRIGIGAAILLYAVAAWGNGFDRISRLSPGAARLVPGVFRAEADRTDATIALTRQQAARARRLAEMAVRGDPTDARGAGLLGAARRAGGDLRGAERAFRIAARFGWRDPLTQAYWYDEALARGDFDLAALRLDALLRSGSSTLSQEALVAPIQQSRFGRDALARRLALNPVWAERYLGPDADLERDPLLLRAEVVTAAGSLGCNRTAPLTRILLDRGERAAAERVWRVNCSQAQPGGLLADRDFRAAARGEDAPFGWRRLRDADVDASFAPLPGGGAELHLRNLGAVTKLVLTQEIDLPARRMAIKGRVTGDRGRVVAGFGCGAETEPPSRVDGDIGEAGQVLTAPQCGNVMLNLWLRPGSGEVILADLSLAPL
ncbi:MAG: hypothetical protein ACREBO_00090 [Novosphingobium sp.]